MFSQIFFFYCALMIIASGMLAISLRNPVHCVLMVLVLFFHMAGVYLTLNAEFLAAVQIIVYAGAILVLFLFVVMLMGNDSGPLYEQLRMQRPAALLVTAALIALLVPVVSSANVLGGQLGTPVRPFSSEPTALAEGLFGGYVLPLEVTAVILLVAMIGAVVLAKRDAYHTPREERLDTEM